MEYTITDRAKQIISNATEEARQLGSDQVGTEHLLLSLIHEKDSVAARVLYYLRISPHHIEKEIYTKVICQPSSPLQGEIPQSVGYRRAIDNARDEARQLFNSYLGTEHLLIGLIQDTEGLAGPILNRFGATVSRARLVVGSCQGCGGYPFVPPKNFALVIPCEVAKRVIAPEFYETVVSLRETYRRLKELPTTKEYDQAYELQQRRNDLEDKIAQVSEPYQQPENTEEEWIYQDRFTFRARRVVSDAIEEARRLGQEQVEIEHLLLALTHQTGPVAVHILNRLDIPLTTLRRAVELEIAPRENGAPIAEVYFSLAARVAIETAIRESCKLHYSYCGTEFLLLSLMQDKEGGAGRALAEVGADLQRVRHEIEENVQSSDGADGGRNSIDSDFPLEYIAKFAPREFYSAALELCEVREQLKDMTRKKINEDTAELKLREADMEEEILRLIASYDRNKRGDTPGA